MKIVTLTLNPTIDIYASVNHVEADRKLRCSEPESHPGGGGLNVSRAIKKLNGDSLALLSCGGLNGEYLKELLRKEEVEFKAISTEDDTRENINIEEDSSEKQYRFIMPGPELRENEWKSFITELEHPEFKPDYIVASGSLPPGVPDDFYAQVCRSGKKLNAKVIIDSSGEPLRLAVKEGAFLFKPNINEVKHLLGRDIESEDEIEEVLRGYIKDEEGGFFVSLGSGGGLLITKQSCYNLRTPTVNIKSKVGAGDSSVAGVVTALTEGKSLRDAVQYGICAGASAVSKGASQLCDRASTDRLYEVITKEK